MPEVRDQANQKVSPRYERQAYRMDMSYLGSKFHGFQSQPTGNAVQDHIEKALAVFLNHQVRVRGASRTDSGVHAHHQVAIFHSNVEYSVSWLPSINALTPKGISIGRIESVSNDFDPIADSIGKAYRYRLWLGRCYNPFVEDFVWPVKNHLDLEVLRKEAQSFVGFHDFMAFCNRDSDAKTSQRRIFEVLCEKRGELIDIWITGEGFLKQMVRIMVGTLVAVASGRMEQGSVEKLLKNSMERKHSGMTAPAQGLALVEVFYEEIRPLREMISRFEKAFILPC